MLYYIRVHFNNSSDMKKRHPVADPAIAKHRGCFFKIDKRTNLYCFSLFSMVYLFFS